MKRREFITLVGAGTATWPLAALGQPASKLPTIGFLGPNPSLWSPWIAAFVQRLRHPGWIEDRTIAIEYRWTEGRPEWSAAAWLQAWCDLAATSQLRRNAEADRWHNQGLAGSTKVTAGPDMIDVMPKQASGPQTPAEAPSAA